MKTIVTELGRWVLKVVDPYLRAQRPDDSASQRGGS